MSRDGWTRLLFTNPRASRTHRQTSTLAKPPLSSATNEGRAITSVASPRSTGDRALTRHPECDVVRTLGGPPAIFLCRCFGAASAPRCKTGCAEDCAPIGRGQLEVRTRHALEDQRALQRRRVQLGVAVVVEDARA